MSLVDKKPQTKTKAKIGIISFDLEESTDEELALVKRKIECEEQRRKKRRL